MAAQTAAQTVSGWAYCWAVLSVYYLVDRLEYNLVALMVVQSAVLKVVPMALTVSMWVVPTVDRLVFYLAVRLGNNSVVLMVSHLVYYSADR